VEIFRLKAEATRLIATVNREQRTASSEPRPASDSEPDAHLDAPRGQR
jgi:hypothetical protein